MDLPLIAVTLSFTGKRPEHQMTQSSLTRLSLQSLSLINIINK